ncbi:MAG: thioredoxin fold domain-containing protein [Gammaproteobacteria bacterium]|nr:thioredoxin fold domain-containing protein [Gammaproteobacteria bacterium]
MNRLFGLIMLCLIPLAVPAQQAVPGDSLENPGYIAEPEWFKESFLDIREDIKEAAAEGKRVMLYFYQDGCPYCKKMIQDNFGQKQIADLSRQYFDTIAVNMWGDREVKDFSGLTGTEKEFAKQLKVQFTPTILLLDQSGEVALRINGYYQPNKFIAALEFVGQGLEKEGSFRDYFAKTDMPAASGKLHTQEDFLQPPYNFSESLKSASDPLLVIFEQKQCLACDELHEDILQRRETKALTDQLQIAVVDMWSDEELRTPDGDTMPARKWAAKLKANYAPTLVFFDKTGREVFRAEAWLKAFHVQSAMEYVTSDAYLQQAEFQRFIEERADELRARGIEVDIMK